MPNLNSKLGFDTIGAYVRLDEQTAQDGVVPYVKVDLMYTRPKKRYVEVLISDGKLRVYVEDPSTGEHILVGGPT